MYQVVLFIGNLLAFFFFSFFFSLVDEYDYRKWKCATVNLTVKVSADGPCLLSLVPRRQTFINHEPRGRHIHRIGHTQLASIITNSCPTLIKTKRYVLRVLRG